MKNAALSLVLLALSLVSLAQSQSDQRPQTAQVPEILILGTYHMANPGHDIHNMQADDVLAPKRQQEMAQLMEALKKFHPTKIAIEASVGNKRVAQQYADYLAGKYTLTQNEDDQIGYRLAKELGHATVKCVDEDGDFPWMRVTDYAKAHGRDSELAAIDAGWAADSKAQGEFLASHSVLETLLYMNDDARVARSIGQYFSVVRLGEPYDYAGADLLAAWYQRNIRIYSNIVKLIDSPNERVLVIYGAGHLGWLRQFVASDPSVKLRKLSEFAK